MANRSEVEVEVVIVPKQRLLALEKMLRSVGLVPSGFWVSGTTARFSPYGLPWTKRTQHRLLVYAVGLMFGVASIALSSTMREADLADLRAEVDVLQPSVQQAMAIRDEIARYQLPPQALVSDRVTALDLVADLTKRLPNNTNLTKLTIRGDQVLFQGFAPKPAAVRSMLTESSWLSELEVSRGGTERSFVAAARLRHSSARGGR